jgi:hypothetical protein
MFLDSLEVHHLWFDCVARTTVQFGPQAGAQLRGALWESLLAALGNNDLAERLMLDETPDAQRGSNPARPFSICPPLGDNPAVNQTYAPGGKFRFGVSLFGTLIELFPYIIQGVYQMGQIGVGYGRGLFSLDKASAINPLTKQMQLLLHDGRIIGVPNVPVTAMQIHDHAQTLPQNHIRLSFITPTQLTGQRGILLSEPEFAPLIARMIERSQQIAEQYAPSTASQAHWKALYLMLNAQALVVSRTACEMRWVNVRSGSRRTNSDKKLSGFVGTVDFTGD